MQRRNVVFLAHVNVSNRYSEWPVFSCPLMAGFECPPRSDRSSKSNWSLLGLVRQAAAYTGSARPPRAGTGARVPVSDRGTFGGLTQFGFRAQPLARKLLLLNTRRDVRVVEGARLEIDSARAC